MGLFSKPDAPEPPDPQETSAAQTGTNISTATANNTMQMVDQFTPYGNLTYQKTGTESIFDPFTEKTYEIPRYSSTQTLNPTQQATLDETQSAEFNLGALANERSDFLPDYLPTTEAAIANGVFRDLYVVIGDPQQGGGYALRSHIKPFANWIWAGAIIMALGGCLSLSDRRHRIAAGARRAAKTVPAE